MSSNKTSRKKLAVGIAGMLAGAMALSACGSSSSSASSATTTKTAAAKPSTSKTFTVAVSVPQETDPYFIAITDYFEKEAEDHGMKVLTANANGSVSRQINQVETFVSEGVNAIAIDSINDKTIVPAIKDANQHHIPVFTIDTQPYKSALDSEHAKIVQTVETDNYSCGVTEAKQMIKWLHGRKAVVGRVILPLAQSTKERRLGFAATVKGHSNISVVATVNGGASYSKSLRVVSEMLQGHPNINVVYGDNGPVGVGAVRAVEGLHDVGKVHVFANATVVPADQYLESGKVFVAGATQFPSVEAATVAYDMWRYLEGHKNQKYLEYTPCNPVDTTTAAAVTKYNEAVFANKEPVQILVNGKTEEVTSSGALKPFTLP